ARPARLGAARARGWDADPARQDPRHRARRAYVRGREGDRGRTRGRAARPVRLPSRSLILAALVAIGLVLLAADPVRAALESRLEDASAFANEPGALLAPGLFAIVSRADTLLSEIADQATRDLTTAPAVPSSSARP